jgi:hypothetical protein
VSLFIFKGTNVPFNTIDPAGSRKVECFSRKELCSKSNDFRSAIISIRNDSRRGSTRRRGGSIGIPGLIFNGADSRAIERALDSALEAARHCISRDQRRMGAALLSHAIRRQHRSRNPESALARLYRRRVLLYHAGTDDHASGLCAWPSRFRR